ncbi:ATP-binding protein [Mycolicibacterium fortuitum]|uniref:ATP-binding protein n=3 Tax=Mycolicibacterium fortuitum TaxID=1766 RepID=UPI0034CE413D
MAVESAQVFKGIHDTPTYTDVLFNKPLRVTLVVPLVIGGITTLGLCVLLLDSGNVQTIFVIGVLLTALATGIGAAIPYGKPNLAFRLTSIWQAVRPVRQSSSDTLILAPPDDVIGHLEFTKHGVYANYLVSGLRYYLLPTKQRLGVADRHSSLGRQVPSGAYIYSFSVPQNQRQLLRAMLHGHRDKPEWVNTCQALAPQLQRKNPRTRIYWLRFPVDAGRAGHTPQGQATKLKDWVAGRDKDSETSLAAYHRLAHEVVTSLPEEFSPIPVTDEMIGWFYRRTAWRGTFTNPVPRRRDSQAQQAPMRFPTAEFDEGDQLHNPGRKLPMLPAVAVLAGLAITAGLLGFITPIVLFGAQALAVVAAWAVGIRRLPSWKKVLRVSSPDGLYPDSYQAILPVTEIPKQGIRFPGSEFLDALDDLNTGAEFDFAINLVAHLRELEFVRNDRAKENIFDQFKHRGDARDGDRELFTTGRQLSEYNRLLTNSTDERPMESAFIIAVGAPDPATLEYSIERLRERLADSGQVLTRHYRGAQTRLWASFNSGVPAHKSTIDQFSYPTTARKWSRFVPITSSQIGNTTGALLGFNTANALNSAVLIDLPGSARRNHTPCLVCSGAPGYGKSYAAKRITRSEFQRGAQLFIIDPGVEWVEAFADVPSSRKVVIDMAGRKFSCDPLRVFPDSVAGGYWLDYMVPMMGLDSRSTGVQRLRTVLTARARRQLKIPTTAALMAYISGIQAPATGPDNRPEQVVKLADDLYPILVALESWATYDFTQAIFDDSLPVPDLDNVDISIWLTESLDLPDAEEMTSEHLYKDLSDRKKASVAIYGMIVRLARTTFFANTSRFGLIVLEEAGGLLNSRAGAHDAHIISRRARRRFTGLLIITQNPVADLRLMGDEFITQQLIVPFENEELAKEVARKAGLRAGDYDDLEEYFLAEPDPEHMREPTDFDDQPDRSQRPDRGDRVGKAFFIDEFRRPAPIIVAHEPDPRLHAAYDTTPGKNAP